MNLFASKFLLVKNPHKLFRLESGIDTVEYSPKSFQEASFSLKRYHLVYRINLPMIAKIRTFFK